MLFQLNAPDQNQSPYRSVKKANCGRADSAQQQLKQVGEIQPRVCLVSSLEKKVMLGGSLDAPLSKVMLRGGLPSASMSVCS